MNLFWFSFVSAVVLGVSFDRVISLGDSVSDTGNFYELSNHKIPSELYYKGRLSNGPVWIEHVANKFSAKLNNYPYAGATSDGDEFQVVPGYHIPGCIQQLQMLKDSHVNEVTCMEDKNILLHLGFFGNDYVSFRTTITHTLNNLERCLTGLLNTTKSTHVIVSTSLDPTCIPFIYSLIAPLRYFLRWVSEFVSLAWEAKLQKLSREYPGVKFYNYDYAEFIQAAANGTLEYTNKHKYILGKSCVTKLSNGSKTLCPNLQDYLFWDKAHTVKQIHKAMAKSITDLIRTGSLRFGHILYNSPIAHQEL
ncbi:hypothetical protein DSO57_1014431 [Entomophthora muscae]|uniref:Uncharacterized protein n=1 Tax=Entomophthora muscae TaxID=34485 RepID=A0ACC2USJ7_9FUNG|nr:hypothetical protein DSO57_1014431 [Entomophthora muscae]